MSKSKGFIAEFKTFISQGNVMDLAVGIIIGGAFTAIVTSLVNDVIMPVVSMLIGGIDFSSLKLTIPAYLPGVEPATVNYGNFIGATVNFLIVAFAVFLMIKAINRVNARSKALAEKAAAKLGKEKAEEDKENAEKTAKAVEDASKAEKKSDAETIALLKEIRDELKSSNKSKK